MESLSKSHCYHCDLPIPENFSANLKILGEQRHFCCLGCFAVAETIVENKLEDYYQFRTEKAVKPEDLPTELSIFDDQDVQKEFVEIDETQVATAELLSENIHCSACAWLIEKKLLRLKGVISINVNVSQQIIHISWNKQQLLLSNIIKQLQSLGYPSTPYQNDHALALKEKQNKSWLKKLGLAGLGMMQVMMYAVALYIGAFDNMDSEHRTFLRWVSFFVATPVLLYSASGFYKSAFSALKQWRLNMDVPIIVALTLAYLSSIWATLQATGEVYFDSVTMFVFFLLIGRYLEFRVRQKVTQQIHQKQDFNDLFVEKMIDGNDKNSQVTPVSKIKIGDYLLVKPGAVLAFDGEVVDGSSMVNEAMLNGEFMPIEKNIGDTVLAGSINNLTPLVIKVTKTQQQGFINQLHKLQQKALSDKPAISQLADKVARYFVLAILCLAAATYWYWHGQSPEDALWITISVLVVTCPCALSLATPVALTCGVFSLNKHNVLVSGQSFLQRLVNLTDIIFDKTGTLTQGQLNVEKVDNFSQLETSKILSIIAALESRSEHPIAGAFKSFIDNNIQAENLEYACSAGVKGQLNFDGQLDTYYFGNYRFLISMGLKEINDELLNTNDLFLATEQQLIAAVQLNDTIRKDAVKAIKALQNKGLKLHLLSGDPSEKVTQLAQQVEIENWQNAQQPQQKIDYVKSLQKNNAKVMMVGDGVNDAPVMAASDASMAMIGASAFTKNNADSYLLSGKLQDIDFAIDKSKHTYKVIKQNLTWALLYNLVMIPFAVAGWIPPYLAAIGMSASSIVVVLNSLRLTKENH